MKDVESEIGERDELGPKDRAVASLVAVVVVALLFATVIYLVSPYLDILPVTFSPH